VSQNTPSTNGDLRIGNTNFTSTEVTFEAISPKGREFLGKVFGAGAVSVNIPKSKGGDFQIYAEGQGITVS
jgi:hypothetical protein